MKYIKFIIIIALTGIMATGCEDFVELDPKTQIPAEEALTTYDNVEAALFGAYEQFASDNFMGGRVMFYSILLGDNFEPLFPINPTDFTGQVITRNVNEVNIDVDNVWSTGYRAIARSNDVINAIDQGLITDGSSQSELNQLKGEALFIRGVSHFELVRLFAQPYSNNPETNLGIPIRIKALTQDEKLERSTVAQVYAQVINDLSQASNLINQNIVNRPNVDVVNAYLARVYFNMLDYENAFEVSNDLLESTTVDFSGNPYTAFRNSGNVSPQGGVFFQIVSGGNFFGGFRPDANSYGLQTGPESITDLLEDSGNNDFRFNSGISIVDGDVFSLKWNDNNINRPIIRLAEIHLIRAESALLKSTVEENLAQQSYDAVRGFAVSGYTPTTLTGTQLLNAIRDERRIELHLEGDRYHDLRRLRVEEFGQIDGVREAVSYDDPANVLEIPFSETSGS